MEANLGWIKAWDPEWGGRKPRVGHNQDLEGAKPKLDQAWDPEWRQTLIGFVPDSEMGGRANQTELGLGENPDWIIAKFGNGLGFPIFRHSSYLLLRHWVQKREKA